MIKLRILIWDASDISNERERLIEVMPKRFKKSAASSIRISRNCISSLLYAQCQLAISAIFKESSALKITSSNDIIVAAYFKNANNSYFIINNLS
ncbi:hypothetical protein RIR_jg17979.t1 [Rhizophagus irregularis DAOM 181602=DAOM 197198]|nr:hypothetical protein RIR_jg17979.t1 [Rhizophagus irregularis DAOM 181602=DAOM 197198]